jgi:hypothetical protein
MRGQAKLSPKRPPTAAPRKKFNFLRAWAPLKTNLDFIVVFQGCVIIKRVRQSHVYVNKVERTQISTQLCRYSDFTIVMKNCVIIQRSETNNHACMKYL